MDLAFEMGKTRSIKPSAFLDRGILQRKCDKRRRMKPMEHCPANRYQSTMIPPEVHEVLRSPGKPLDSATRVFLERRFGHSLSHVRIHTGDMAVQSAEEVRASAYTVGKHIVFGAGRYTPGTTFGLKLLAHEIAHTIQQGSKPHSKILISPPNGPLEEEADRSAALAVLPESSLNGPIPVTLHSSGLLQGVRYAWPGEDIPSYMAAYTAHTEARLLEESRARCEGIRVLERLSRQPMSPSENIRRLERLIRLMPNFIRMREALHAMPNPSPDDLDTYRAQLERAGLSADLFVGSEEEEIAMARCELSRARLEEFLANQGRRMPGRLLRPRD